MKKYGWWLIIGLVFLGLRLYKIENRVEFTMDQGLFMSKAYEIWQKKEITLLGPTASPIVNGRQFFQGPIIYYALVVLGVLAKWDPVRISWEIAILGMVGLAFFGMTLNKLWGRNTAIIGGILFAIWPTLITFGNFIWNPNFLLIITPVLMWTMVNSWWLLAGIIAGIGLQFHFQFGLIILLILGWLVYKKTGFIKFVAGAAIGYSPLIIFDLRNHFYNVRTIAEWLLGGKGSSLGFQTHYWLAILIIVLVGVSWFLGKIWDKNRIVIVGLLMGLMIFSVVSVIKSQNYKYVDLEKAERIILEAKINDFEVAVTTGGDTRFYAMRYLLMKDGIKVMSVDEYPKAKVLYLMAPFNRPPEIEKVWEVSSLGKIKVINKVKINEKIDLYQIQKDNG